MFIIYIFIFILRSGPLRKGQEILYFFVKKFVVKSLLADAFSGRILIDGVDIAELGLGTLRSKLTIIPQVTTIHNVVFAWEDLDQRVWKDIKITRLSRRRMIWLLPQPHPPLSRQQDVSLSVSSVWRRSSLLTGAGEEHWMLLIRKLFPVQCRIDLPDPYYFIKDSTKFKKKIQSLNSSLLLI